MSYEVIDFHAHLPPGEDAVLRLAAAYERAGISKGILVPGNMLDSSDMAGFMRGRTSLRSFEPDNEATLAVCKGDPRFLAFFNLDPEYHLPQDVLEARRLGYAGYKFNPLVLKSDLRRRWATELVKAVEEVEGCIYTHLTLSPGADLEAVVSLAQTFRKVRFVIGHMGFASADRGALDAASIHSNIFLESSIGSIPSLQQIKERRLISRLLFGSEYPLHDPGIELQKLKLLFNDSECERICSRNASELLGLPL